MTIDTSGKWWKGTSAHDIAQYLEELFEESYPIHEYRQSVCECGSEVFSLHWIPDEDVARRTCAKCRKKHFICDSREFWEGRPKKYKCIECHSVETNVGVAFSMDDDKTAIRWLYVGNRCTNCGVLGSVADWKIGYEPSLNLLTQA